MNYYEFSQTVAEFIQRTVQLFILSYVSLELSFSYNRHSTRPLNVVFYSAAHITAFSRRTRSKNNEMWFCIIFALHCLYTCLDKFAELAYFIEINYYIYSNEVLDFYNSASTVSPSLSVEI